MSYLVPQLITVAAYALLFWAGLQKGDGSLMDFVLGVPAAAAFVVSPVWLSFYYIELVFYR